MEYGLVIMSIVCMILTIWCAYLHQRLDRIDEILHRKPVSKKVAAKVIRLNRIKYKTKCKTEASE